MAYYRLVPEDYRYQPSAKLEKTGGPLYEVVAEDPIEIQAKRNVGGDQFMSERTAQYMVDVVATEANRLRRINSEKGV